MLKNMPTSKIKQLDEQHTSGLNPKSENIADDYYDDPTYRDIVKSNIATDMSNMLRIIYIFNMVSTFTITLLVGFKFYGFTLDPITYIVSVVSFLTFTGITTFITKLLK